MVCEECGDLQSGNFKGHKLCKGCLDKCFKSLKQLQGEIKQVGKINVVSCSLDS